MGSNSPGRGPGSAPSSYGNLSIDQIEAELRTHFAVQWRKYTFEGLLGRGAFGLTFRVVEKLSADKFRRLAIKRSLRPRQEDDLRNEIEWLKTLRGAEHIVRILASRDDRESTAGPRRGRRTRLRHSPLNLQDSLTGLYGPIVVLEYLENADITRLYNRLVQHDQLLPNRILWSFFLCLIRACVALAYPPRGAEDEPNVLETVPTDGTAPSMIEHADLHTANIMIGEVGGGFAEHNLVPPLKFIDFGRTREGFQGVSDNVWKISRIMINLIARQQVRISAWISDYQGFETRATEILHHGNGAKYPTLDDDLRDFLARCLADEERDRPTLANMLEIAENAVKNKTAAAYPGQAGETDEEIRNLLQRFIYDADT
ncbi:kinase-like domain-containing protein [Hypoxylon sp. FL0890]|nr:kinase-like domain-containing protein [Hypoxylon sp. FL0890]